MREPATTDGLPGELEATDTASKSLLSLLDDWAMGLPSQSLRDGLLLVCGLFVVLQISLGDGQGSSSELVQKSSSETSGNGWRFLSQQSNQRGRAKLVSTKSSVAPITQRHRKTTGSIVRESVDLEPSEFEGFENIPGDHWVVQLAAFDSMKPLQSMVQRFQLAGAIGATLKIKSKEMHVLLLDVYPSKQQALLASQDLPAGLDELNPWVRSVASIRKKLK